MLPSIAHPPASSPCNRHVYDLTFACLKCRSSFTSRSVRFVSTGLAKAERDQPAHAHRRMRRTETHVSSSSGINNNHCVLQAHCRARRAAAVGWMQSDAIPSRPVTLLRPLVLLTFGDLLDSNLLSGLEILGRAAGSHSDTQPVSEPTPAVAVVPAAAAAAAPLVLCVCPHHTTPYAPVPMGLMSLYFLSTSNRVPQTRNEVWPRCESTGAAEPAAAAAASPDGADMTG